MLSKQLVPFVPGTRDQSFALRCLPRYAGQYLHYRIGKMGWNMLKLFFQQS